MRREAAREPHAGFVSFAFSSSRSLRGLFMRRVSCSFSQDGSTQVSITLRNVGDFNERQGAARLWSVKLACKLHDVLEPRSRPAVEPNEAATPLFVAANGREDREQPWIRRGHGAV